MSGRINYLWLYKTQSLPSPWSTKKKRKIKAAQAAKKKGKIIAGQIKAVETGLEDFVDRLDLTASNPAEEWEEDMYSLAAGFIAWMHKRAASAQGEITPGSKVFGGKHQKRSSLEEPCSNYCGLPRTRLRCSTGLGGCLLDCFQRGLCIPGGWGPSRGTSQC